MERNIASEKEGICEKSKKEKEKKKNYKMNLSLSASRAEVILKKIRT